MLDEKDLQAIRELLSAMEQRNDAKLEAMEQRTDAKLEAMEQRIAKNTVAPMDAQFSKQFNLLAEGQQEIRDMLVPRSRVDDLEDEVKFLKTVVRQISEEVQKLKKTQ
ncbi:MAG: hypothetical protein VB071_01680 [Lawsonibacter sp.]|nr:hypothetical protein [Lawsonibacter sp.]